MRRLGLWRPTLQYLPRRSPTLRQQFSAYRNTSRSTCTVEPIKHVQNKNSENYHKGYHDGFANGERRGRWHGLGITTVATAASAAVWYHYRQKGNEVGELKKLLEELKKYPQGEVKVHYLPQGKEVEELEKLMEGATEEPPGCG